VPRDPARAARLCLAAARQGVAEAQWRLAGYLQRGFGVPADRTEALRWLREAARWLSDPTNLSFPDAASRDRYLAQQNAHFTAVLACQSEAESLHRDVACLVPELPKAKMW